MLLVQVQNLVGLHSFLNSGGEKSGVTRCRRNGGESFSLCNTHEL